MNPEPTFLHDPSIKLLLFGGKGGVGKTTAACSTAIYLANQTRAMSFRLVSTDPAHSLNDSLNGSPLPSNLEVLELDAKECARQFLGKYDDKLREIAARGTFLDNEDINRFMQMSLPGLDEMMAFLEIAGWVETGKFDCIIVDTAPTGHTLRLLGMPELIRNWLEAADALLAKHRYMRSLFNRRYQPDELDEFLVEVETSVSRLEQLFRDRSRSRFVPVMIPEQLSITETAMLLDKLEQLGVAVSDLIVNKLIMHSDCPVCTELQRFQMKNLAAEADRFSQYTLWGVPLYPQEIRSVAALNRFWTSAKELDCGRSDRSRQ